MKGKLHIRLVGTIFVSVKSPMGQVYDVLIRHDNAIVDLAYLGPSHVHSNQILALGTLANSRLK